MKKLIFTLGKRLIVAHLNAEVTRMREQASKLEIEGLNSVANNEDASINNVEALNDAGYLRRGANRSNVASILVSSLPYDKTIKLFGIAALVTLIEFV